MYEFFHDYVEPKYGVKVKLCYMNTCSFIVHLKTEDIYSDIVKDVETRFKTSVYELDRPLPKGKNKVIDLMKDELGGTIMKESVALRAKTCSHLTDNNDEDKKRQKCVVKRKHKFEDYKHCLEATQVENRINHLGKK